MLVNNVGVTNDLNKFSETDEKEILNMIIVNCIPIVMMTRVLLPYMLSRKNRGAIVNIASISGRQPHPYHSLYSSSKVFDDYFSLGLE